MEIGGEIEARDGSYGRERIKGRSYGRKREGEGRPICARGRAGEVGDLDRWLQSI